MYLCKVAEYNQLISQLYVAPSILSQTLHMTEKLFTGTLNHNQNKTKQKQTLQSFVYVQSYWYPRFIHIDTWGIGNIVNKQRVVPDRIAGASCVDLL